MLICGSALSIWLLTFVYLQVNLMSGVPQEGCIRAEVNPEIVLIVPGGGLTTEGSPTGWVHARLRKAAELYRYHTFLGSSCRVVTLSGGTPHKPMPIDPKSEFQVYEGEANARCLIAEHGIPATDVLEENWSLDTIGNAYMLRMMHTDVAGWRHLVIVNNEFHMGRTRAIFQKVFSLPPTPEPYTLQFVEVANEGLDEDILKARKAREESSIATFRRNTENFTSLRDMHKFIFSDHMAYSSKRLLKERVPVDPKTLATY